MPVYNYECQECGHVFEKRIKYDERFTPELSPCPECGNLKILFVLARGSGPGMGDSVRLGIRRPDEGFKDVLREINKNTKTRKESMSSRYI